MSIHYLGKRREALGLTGEKYKKLVREFLEQSGYGLITDSSIEGHLPDMVLVHPDKLMPTWVECKGTEIGPNDERFVKELMQYFNEWLKKIENRFELFIFAVKLNDSEGFERIIGSKYTKKNLQLWYKNNLSKLPVKLQKKLKEVAFQDIVHFFSQIELYEASVDYLRIAITEKGERSIFSMRRYAENLLQDSKRRSIPLREKSELISNLIHLNFPQKYYVAKTKYKKKESIYNNFNSDETEIPPFLFDPETQTVSTFDPIQPDCPLRKALKTEPAAIKIDARTSQQFVSAMINQHLRRILWKKGLTRISKTDIYYFQAIIENGVLKDRFINVFKRKKMMAHVYNKNNEEGIQLNFVFHTSAEIRPHYIWNQYYLQINPCKTFTIDGQTPIEGKKKSALDRFFRNPIYNRNSQKLSEMKFWKDLLMDDGSYIMPKEDWFAEFKFGTMEIVPFDYIPQTTKRGQTRLKEFE